MSFRSWLVEKLNPAQEEIARDYNQEVTTETRDLTKYLAYDNIEAVNRGCNMLISACCALDYDVKDQIGTGIRLRSKALHKLLNFAPNPYQSAQDFRQNIFTDFVFEGISFIYFDGAHIYHLPSIKTSILPHPKTFIKGYKYNNTTEFTTEEVFTFKDINSNSIYRGSSRLDSALRTVRTIYSMQDFQTNAFENGAMFGQVLTTDNPLSEKAKEKTILHFIQKYNTRLGGKRPVILDNGLKPHPMAQTNFKDLDFDTAMKTHSDKILTAIGVPSILLAGGNNANINPNLRLFYLETVIPIVKTFTSALERFFGYDIDHVTSGVTALEPDLRELASFNSTLVNGGIISANEARQNLRLSKKGPEHDELRIPANIAGSAADPSVGGRPKKEEEEEDEG